MNVGVQCERRATEHRVSLTPAGARTLIQCGHGVLVESGAGEEAGHSDADYASAGATIVYARSEAIGRPDLLLGVLAPDPSEYELFRPGQAVLAFWGLPAAHGEDLRRLCEREITAIGIEAIADSHGHAPVLTSMSEIAGPLAVTLGAQLLLNEGGGKGILLGGAPGVPPANLVVLGAGVLGTAAARTAAGMGAEVLLVDRSVHQLRTAVERIGRSIPTLVATPPNLERTLGFADLVIASPAVRGAGAPLLVTRAMLRSMKPRAVVMDLSIDMGGCLETSRPTAFPHPIYEVDGIRHFCVPNLPAIAARSATLALTNALTPYLEAIASQGVDAALLAHPELRRGVYLYHGRCVNESLAELFGLALESVSGPGG
jgi:alanine dehydrogenase